MFYTTLLHSIEHIKRRGLLLCSGLLMLLLLIKLHVIHIVRIHTVLLLESIIKTSAKITHWLLIIVLWSSSCRIWELLLLTKAELIHLLLIHILVLLLLLSLSIKALIIELLVLSLKLIALIKTSTEWILSSKPTSHAHTLWHSRSKRLLLGCRHCKSSVACHC